ncbi:ParA family protein [Priestia aryabhattai]|uniref:ParA family protein n=1 Tax=Priestia aryabhattai TaxID=412384 RepID=UPI002881616A|nr:ParA family protein [Priestia aryabhattai]MDT0150044.1 ParA family protein [Priestia aryabhattai]MDT0155614.1 ParA family protein [Priestia aryabhattai]
MGKVITVTMQKGGVGKTSFVTNLVGAIARTDKKKRMLIIDMDAQGNVGRSFGKPVGKYENGLDSLFLGTKHISECIYKLFGNVDILPVTPDMAFLELKLFIEMQKTKRPLSILEDEIGYIKDDYDLIFIDTPPTLNFIVGNALKVSDGVLIPFEPEPYGIDGLVRIIDVLHYFRTQLSIPVKILGVIGLRVNTFTTHNENMKKARQACVNSKIKMFDTSISRSVRYSDAVQKKDLPATLTKIRKKPKDPVIDYYELLEEMIKEGVL